jgi:hypothetical protein
LIYVVVVVPSISLDDEKVEMVGLERRLFSPPAEGVLAPWSCERYDADRSREKDSKTRVPPTTYRYSLLLYGTHE